MVAELETIGGALEDVRAFCAVFELGSISAAARQLGTTKGGLSRRVSRLEGRLGVTLLARTPRAVSPTEEGAAFYAKARDALTLLDEAADGARQSQSEPRGHLRVTAPLDFGVDVLPPLIVEFRARYPQVTVELLVSDALLDLAAQRIDLALRASVQDLPIALYASPGYLASRKSPRKVADLADHDIVATGDSRGAEELTLTNARGRRASVTIRPPIRAGNFASACRFLQAGGGIGALPDVVAAAGVEAGLLAPVLPDWILARGRLHAITVAGRQAPARVRAFREFIGERLSTTPPR